MEQKFCEQCSLNENESELTAIHIDIEGLRVTLYFHNLAPRKDCLKRWLSIIEASP